MNSYTLRDLVKIKNGKDHKSQNTGTIPVYGSGGLMLYVDKPIYDRESVLLPRKGTLDNIQYVDHPFWTVDTIYYTEINNSKVVPYYLYYYLKQLNLSKLNTGTGVPSMTFDSYYDVPVKLPSLVGQKKIASVLSALDDKIELNRKINAELERMARTLYDYWFVQFDFPDANGKPYKSSGGQMAYNDQLKREIPAGWKAVQLEDILNKRTENAEPNSNLRCIDLSVMPSGSLSIDNFSAGDAFNSNMKKMHKNDILFGSIRPYLKKAGLAPFDGLRAGTVHAFYPRKPEHLELCLITMTSERYFDYAINRSGGSTRMPSISSDDLLDYSVPFSEDVYFKYHKVLTSFTDAISNNIQQSQKLAELRDWLLPMLMNGQVKVV